MEKMVYDSGIDAALEIIEHRLDYYDCLVIADKAGEMEWCIIEELEVIRDMIKKLKYY